MRLKIIFTPLALLMAIVISIWYTSPAIKEIRNKMKELESSREKLESTIARMNNSEMLKISLDENKDKESFMLNYLPSAKSEEKIIGGINYLATDSGLNLSSLTLKAAKEDNLAIADEAMDEMSDPDLMVSDYAKPELKAKSIDVEAALSGKYDNIKIFLGQIHKMETLNNIVSLTISKESSDSSEEGADGEILSAEIGMKFEYLPEISEKGGGVSPIFSQSNFDFGPISKIKEMIMEKIPVLEEGQKGKSNPFLP